MRSSALTTRKEQGRIVAVLNMALIVAVLAIPAATVYGDGTATGPTADVDSRVSRFLNETQDTWSGWNVPYEDGKALFDYVLKRGFRNILEIGTSTGHSTIWLAWAAAKGFPSVAGLGSSISTATK